MTETTQDTFIPFPGAWPQPTILKLDNTKRESYCSCPRRYFYVYIMGYKSLVGSTALRYGIVWHKVMEKFYAHIAENGWTRDGKALEAGIQAGQVEWDRYSEKQDFYEDYRTLQNLFTAFIQYTDHFAHDDGFLKIIEPEKVYQILMEPDPETGLWTMSELETPDTFAGLSPFYFTGKRDLTIELNSLPWIMEFKTSGQALALQKSRLHRRTQYMGYIYAAKKELGIIPEGMLVSLHQLSAYKSKKTGLYGKPKIDFDRSPQIFDEGDLMNWKLSFLDTAERIQADLERNLWPMRFDSCYTYGRCGFCNICEQNRPLGEENLQGFIQAEPWDVTKEES